MIATKTIQKPHKTYETTTVGGTSRFVNEGNQLRNLVTKSPSSKENKMMSQVIFIDDNGDELPCPEEAQQLAPENWNWWLEDEVPFGMVNF